jgi:FixJ family two-component response regulator
MFLVDRIRKPIVAVVDDDPRVRESLESLIESAGLTARVFSLARDFLLDGLTKTDCLITDVRMPELDGLELQQHLQLRRPEMPVIFITGHHEDEVERRAFAQGAVSFIHKPFDAEELLRAVTVALSLSAGDQESLTLQQEGEKHGSL